MSVPSPALVVDATPTASGVDESAPEAAWWETPDVKRPEGAAPPWVYAATLALLIAIVVGGVTANGAVILLFRRRPELLTPTNSLVVSIAYPGLVACTLGERVGVGERKKVVEGRKEEAAGGSVKIKDNMVGGAGRKMMPEKKARKRGT